MKKHTMNGNMDTLPKLYKPVERYANSVAAVSGNTGINTSGFLPDWVPTPCKLCKAACNRTVC